MSTEAGGIENRETTLSRGSFLGLAAGTAAAAAMGTWAPKAFASERLVPPGKLGVQLFTVRDAVSRLDNSVVDPTNGTLLRGGFRGVFETLASFGYKEIEFAGYTQGANGPITTEQIRQALDDNGLRAVGAHLGLNALRNNLEFELDRCEILGMPFIGTANAPTSDRTVAGYQAAAAEFNTWGAATAARGIKLYQHNHTEEFSFATDDASVRLYDVWLAGTDPKLVFLELDIYWAYAARNLFPGFEPLDYVKAQPQRYPLYHVKDGAAAPPPDPDGLVFVDVGDGIIDFRTFFDEQGKKGYRHYIMERDNAPGGSADPGRSFRSAQRSAEYLLSLRA
ncbi:MAG: sugar phosphate isomerase/epimerase family protein [Candidatus Limnocylindria bacterium]